MQFDENLEMMARQARMRQAEARPVLAHPHDRDGRTVSVARPQRRGFTLLR